MANDSCNGEYSHLLNISQFLWIFVAQFQSNFNFKIAVSTASDVSSSMCSNSVTDETVNIWPDLNETHGAQQLLATAQNAIANDHLINQVDANDMVIVNGVILDQNSTDSVEYDFEHSQIVDSFFTEPHQSASPLLQHHTHPNDSSIAKGVTSPMLNDTSTEVNAIMN